MATASWDRPEPVEVEEITLKLTPGEARTLREYLNGGFEDASKWRLRNPSVYKIGNALRTAGI